MRNSPFISITEFEEEVAKGYEEARRAAMPIVCRWSWLCQGYIGLPFDFSNMDLVSVARRSIKEANGMPVPEFPLSPRDYRQTVGAIHTMMPPKLQEEFGEPEDPDQAVFWGQGALGHVPALYAGPQSDFRAPGTFWDRADREVGGMGYGENRFETWLYKQEGRIYNEADPLADYRIRAYWCGYVLHRARANFSSETVWQATHLPIPVLAWWSRAWLRLCDPMPNGRGLEEDIFGRPEEREKVITAGLAAINKEGGWASWPDPMSRMGDWQVTIDHEGKPLKISMMFMGILGSPIETVQAVGGPAPMAEIFEAAAAELNRFGFDVKPISFDPSLFE